MATLDLGMRWIWRDGAWVSWEDAHVHVMSHAVHYGSSVFEGIRAYDTARGPAIFRLTDHLRRLHESAKIYRMEVPWPVEALAEACRELLRPQRACAKATCGPSSCAASARSASTRPRAPSRRS